MSFQIWRCLKSPQWTSSGLSVHSTFSAGIAEWLIMGKSPVNSDIKGTSQEAEGTQRPSSPLDSSASASQMHRLA